MNCDHVRHEHPVPATHAAAFIFSNGDHVTRHLCDEHTEELRALVYRGASAFGLITDTQITSL